MGTSSTSPPASGKPRTEWGQARFAPNQYIPLLYHVMFSLHYRYGLLCSLWYLEGFFFFKLALQLSTDIIKLIRAKILPHISMVCTSILFTATSQFWRIRHKRWNTGRVWHPQLGLCIWEQGNQASLQTKVTHLMPCPSSSTFFLYFEKDEHRHEFNLIYNSSWRSIYKTQAGGSI